MTHDKTLTPDNVGPQIDLCINTGRAVDLAGQLLSACAQLDSVDAARLEKNTNKIVDMLQVLAEFKRHRDELNKRELGPEDSVWINTISLSIRRRLLLIEHVVEVVRLDHSPQTKGDGDGVTQIILPQAIDLLGYLLREWHGQLDQLGAAAADQYGIPVPSDGDLERYGCPAGTKC